MRHVARNSTVARDGTNGNTLVVLCAVGNAVERVRSRFPLLEIVDVSAGVPLGVRGDILFGGWGPRSVEAMSTGVRWVQLAGTGVDGLAPEVRSAPLLTSARGASAVAIGEYVLAVMAAFARNFPLNWLDGPPPTWNFQEARPLAGATVGIVGFGGIGRRVARLAQAFDMRVMAVRRHRSQGVTDGVELVASIGELMEAVEHLVLAAPATASTRHIVNADSLAAAQPGLHLVNIARGSLVDHDALRRALDDGTVARASLDVTDPEPLPAGHWLYEHPKVFLTPHASWTGPPPLAAAVELFCDNLERYLTGDDLHGVVGDDGY